MDELERPDLPPHLPDLPDLSRVRVPSTRLLDAAQPGVDKLIHLVWKTTVHHPERVPQGPAIFACNHVGLFDGPLAVALLPQAQAMAKKELWSVGPLGRLLDALGQVPVDRWNPDPDCIRRCIQLLDAGRKLVIFPESHRGRGDFHNFKRGAGYLAMVTGAPVVPVALLGTSVGGKGLASVPRPRREVHVVYGDKVVVEPKAWPRTAADVADVTAMLRGACRQHIQQAQAEVGLELH